MVEDTLPISLVVLKLACVSHLGGLVQAVAIQILGPVQVSHCPFATALAVLEIAFVLVPILEVDETFAVEAIVLQEESCLALSRIALSVDVGSLVEPVLLENSLQLEFLVLQRYLLALALFQVLSEGTLVHEDILALRRDQDAFACALASVSELSNVLLFALGVLVLNQLDGLRAAESELVILEPRHYDVAVSQHHDALSRKFVILELALVDLGLPLESNLFFFHARHVSVGALIEHGLSSRLLTEPQHPEAVFLLIMEVPAEEVTGLFVVQGTLAFELAVVEHA
mmetsp:Transcript_5894/g.9557  ORF Transcript_5894/g.9557 Transcript_5894/m.9557 type:complete len:285 (-) Transcript_5894:1972-2826(-)